MPHPDSGERPLSVFWQLPEVPSLLRDFPQLQHTGGSNELVDKGRGALVRGGNVTTAEKLVDALNQEFPLDTLMQNYWLPRVRAAIELLGHDSAKAIGILHASGRYELADPPPFSAGTMYRVYLRGEVYLGAGNGGLAAAEFQKILDHPGVIVTFR